MFFPEFSYYVELVFWYLKLVVVLSLAVIGFVIRRKWRLAVVREVEISRLMVLAAEEAARAELEAVGYYAYGDVTVIRDGFEFGDEVEEKGELGYFPEAALKGECAEIGASGGTVYQCVVCLSSTTTRCARCKSARYCSAKCQIFHWRRGHKDECHAPSILNQPYPESYTCIKVVNQDKDETLSGSFEPKDRHLKSCYTHLEGKEFYGFGQMEQLYDQNDNFKNDHLQEVKSSSSTLYFTSDSSSSVFSDSSDGASTTRKRSSSSPDKSNGRQQGDISKQAKSTAMCAAVPSILNLTQPILYQCDNQRALYDIISSNANAKVSNLLVAMSGASEFWEGALDSEWSESVETKSDVMNGDISDLGSCLHWSSGSFKETEYDFHLDGKTLPSSDSNVLKKIDIVSSRVERPIQSSSKTCRPTRGMDNSVSSVSVNKAGGYNLSDVIISPHNGASKAEARKVSNARLSSSSKADPAIKSSSSISKTMCSYNSNGDGTVLVKIKNNFATSERSYSDKDVNCSKNSVWKAVEHFKASNMSKDCGTDERYDNKGMFSFKIFKSLYRWNKVELLPRGLVNCGNSCYANAVLQCLAFTPPLTAYLLQGLHSKNCTKRDWCFTCEFENLILKAKDGNSPISPIGIISHLPNIGSHLSNGREEDAHEFLRYVVDTMQSVCIKNAANKVAGKIEEETTLLGLTFGGYLQSKIRCMKCGNNSERSERIMDLSVEIEEGSIRSLEDALDCFTRSETLDAENKYNCARCKSYQKAKKKLTVFEAPNILTIALKRFQVGKYGKLNKWIDFPEVLDMSRFMSQKNDYNAPVYKLYGVIVHLDTMNAAFSGHYVCYVKNIQDKWFKIDDSVVIAVDFGKVKEQAAYMLLYARCLPKAPKSLRDKLYRDVQFKSTMPLAGSSIILDCATKSDADCNKHHMKVETDWYSDSNSLFSSGSEDNSCSLDSSSARESSSEDDLADLIFGNSGRMFSYPWTSSSSVLDSSSPSASPLYS